LLPSRNSPVALAPQVPKEPRPVQQVRFLEAPNFQYQKKVHFLLHLCPKAKQRKNLYPQPLPALRDPRKLLQYPLQPSRRHHLYQEETPREYHRRSLLTDHVWEEQARHRDHLVPQHHPHPQLLWQETLRLPNSWEVPYDGNPTKAQACWNTLDNYYTMNEAVYNTNDKKVPAALTNFKAGTRGGDWASDRIAEALAANPTNYGTWAQFWTAFEKQFIPPQVQQEAIKGIHDTYMGNQEFNDWYQDWTHHA